MRLEEMSVATKPRKSGLNHQTLRDLKPTNTTGEGRNKQLAVFEGELSFGTELDIGSSRLCKCGPTHINCMEPKDWLKSQIGVWQFLYESRDIRDKSVHPATFPISLAKKIIELFTHQGQLVIDPFVGSGTSLVAANDLYIAS